jgi:hypothetical protein
MVSPRDVEAIWSQLADFELTLPEPDEEENLCVFARRYQAWAREMCAPILENPSVDQIHLGMLLNTMQYYETRAILPKRHRNHVGERGHTCVFHVAERTFYFLRLKLFSLREHTVLLLPKPAPPPPPPPPVLESTILGLAE